MLLLQHLYRSFREGPREHRVLHGASAEIENGSTVAIVGRSGSGKSTLLNLISGIDSLDSGRIVIDGREVSSLGEPQRTLFRRAHVGFVYQFFNLIATLDVEENVRLVLELNGVRGREAQQRTRAMLAHVGLDDRAHGAVDALSGGEQQRLAIARALVHAPEVVLADEPTGNLDEQSAREIVPLIRSLSAERGATLLIVTHDPAIARSAERLLELKDGRLHEASRERPA